jgi:hypothetical protein
MSPKKFSGQQVIPPPTLLAVSESPSNTKNRKAGHLAAVNAVGKVGVVTVALVAGKLSEVGKVRRLKLQISR